LFRSSFAPLCALAGLVLIGAASSEASEVSEVTIPPPKPAQMRIAHSFEYAPSAVSEVTVPGGAGAGTSRVVVGTEPLLAASTVSEVTIQPGRELAARSESRRTGKSLAAGDAPSVGSSSVPRK
jgi:hypothetical protein